MASDRRRCTAPVAIAGLGAAYVTLQWLGRTAGATRAECRATMPGDELVGHPMMVTTHAVTVDAVPEQVWPWLVQMGWHRGGW